MNILAGKLLFAGSAQVARVLVMNGAGHVCAESLSDDEGRWRLECAEEPEWVLAYTFEEGIAAVVKPAHESEHMNIPLGHVCSVICDGADAYVEFALNPIYIDDMSDAHTSAMHWQADGNIRLYVAHWSCAPTPRALYLQTGRYRLSGGSYTLHPGSEPGMRLTSVSVGNNAIQPNAAGEMEFDINSAEQIVIRFGRARGDE